MAIARNAEACEIGRACDGNASIKRVSKELAEIGIVGEAAIN